MRKDLFVERVAIRLRADQMDGKFVGLAAGKPEAGILACGLVRSLDFLGLAMAMDKGQAKRAGHVRADGDLEGVKGRGRRQIFGGLRLEWPHHQVRRQPVAAGNIAIPILEGGVEIGAAGRFDALPQHGVAVFGIGLDQQG